MSTIITRVGYCPKCAREHKPYKGSIFLCYGSCREGYYAREAIRNGIEGYTPHIYILDQVTKDGICVVSCVCGMYGCSVEQLFTKDRKCVYSVVQNSWEHIYLPIKDWNALTTLKRDKQWQI